jgi:DNA polymerase I-like protein with 3'-5' exonuclease and polymerase domains
VRSYVIPGTGRVFVDRDYSQQEPRILAHFDGGSLLDKYLENPWVDFHDYAKAELEKAGLFYDRKPVKNTNLGLIYGMGVGKLAEKNDMTVEESANLKKAILRLYPGLADMYKDMRVRADNNQPIRTWGGREYYCEPPKLIDGRLRKFDYKLVNVLIQGSAADCTKEAILRWHRSNAAAHPEWHLLLNIHDQLTVSVPVAARAKAMEALREAMEGVEFSVAMLSEGSWSPDNWASLKDYDKKGKQLEELPWLPRK